MYVKIREHATNVVNMVTIEEIVGRKNKTSSVGNAKDMDTSLKSVTAGRGMVKNAYNFTRRLMKIRYNGRNQNIMKKRERKHLM